MIATTSRHLRRVVVPVMTIVLILASCKRTNPVDPSEGTDAGAEAGVSMPADAASGGPRIEYAPGPTPGPDTVLASAGEHEVTLAEFEHATQVSLLFSPTRMTKMPPERLALPHVHVTLTRSLLGTELIRAEAKRRGLGATDDEAVAWLRASDRLARFGEAFEDEAKLAELLAPYELTREDLLDVARTEVEKDALSERLVTSVTDDEVWSAYAAEKHRREIALVSTSNVPTSEEIDEFVTKRGDVVEEHFRRNPARYRIPRRVRVHLVQPSPGEKVTEETMRAAADDLRAGIQPVTVAKRHGLRHSLDVELMRGENPEAFESKAGSVGWVMDGPRGALAWKVQGFVPSRIPELSRPLRREIAAELLRTREIVPHAKEELEQAAELLERLDADATDEEIAALRREIEALGETKLDVVKIGAQGGTVPGYGLAEEVVSTAFSAKVGEVVAPLTSRERGFVFRVLDEQKPTRSEFRANIEQYRRAYEESYRPRALSVWVEERLRALGARVDTQPLRVKYGVLQK